MKFTVKKLIIIFFYTFACGSSLRIHASPEQMANLAQRAQQLYYNWQFDQAIDVYKQVITHYPTCAQAHFNIGFIYATYKNNNDAALYHYQQALTLDPSYTKVHFYLGKILEQKHEYDQALNHYLYTTDMSDTYQPLAGLLFNHRNITNANQAIAFCSHHIGSSSDCVHTLIALATIMEKQHKLSDAIMVYKYVNRITDNQAAEQLARAYRTYVGITKNSAPLYQDFVIDGDSIPCGNQACMQRYAVIKNILDTYQRPITVIDLNPQYGYFSFKIAQDYRATCVMVSPEPYLKQLCALNSDINTILLLQKDINCAELKRLGECEHFDVVLAFDYINWFTPQWQETVDAIFSLGQTIVIETPFTTHDTWAQSHNQLINQYLTEKGAQHVHTTKLMEQELSANIYVVTQDKKSLTRTHWTRAHKTQEYRIESSYQEKFLCKYPLWNKSPWHKGINLLTFKMLNGVYPTQETIAKQIHNLDAQQHNDLNISNVIIQGNTLMPIDCDDQRITTDQNSHSAIATIINHLREDPEKLYELVS